MEPTSRRVCVWRWKSALRGSPPAPIATVAAIGLQCRHDSCFVVYVAEEQDSCEDTQATVAPDLLCATPSPAGVSHHPLWRLQGQTAASGTKQAQEKPQHCSPWYLSLEAVISDWFMWRGMAKVVVAHCHDGQE